MANSHPFEDHQFGYPDYTVTPEQFDKEIFAGYSPPPRLEGVPLEPNNGVLEAGIVLARVAATGQYQPYNANAAATGDNIPRCILRSGVDTGSGGATKVRPGEAVFSGVLKLGAAGVPGDGTSGTTSAGGLDDAAVTALGARVDAVRGIVIF